MGMVEEKIRQELMQEIFSDTTKIYEFIESRFKLDDKQREELISKINMLNNNLTLSLKNVELS